MTEINISTLNVQSNNSNCTSKLNNAYNSEVISKMIIERDFDFIGLQETSTDFLKSLGHKLTDFKIYGGYEYNKRYNKSFFNKYNNFSSIIMKESKYYNKMHKIPYVKGYLKALKGMILGNHVPMIVTVGKNNGEKEAICIINTHIDYRGPNYVIQQLEELKHTIKTYQKSYETILIGDFNIDMDNINFKNFQKDLDIINMQRININKSTQLGNIGATSHIFIPNAYEVKETDVFSNNQLFYMTDHKGVYAKIQKK